MCEEDELEENVRTFIVNICMFLNILISITHNISIILINHVIQING